jgi:hypothetical protein
MATQASETKKPATSRVEQNRASSKRERERERSGDREAERAGFQFRTAAFVIYPRAVCPCFSSHEREPTKKRALFSALFCFALLCLYIEARILKETHD